MLLRAILFFFSFFGSVVGSVPYAEVGDPFAFLVWMEL